MSTDPVQDSIDYEDAREQEGKAYWERFDFHKDNWIDAVTKSPNESFGAFLSNTSEDIFLDALCNKDFEKKLARLLIDGYNSGKVDNSKLNLLFNDLAEDYAEGKLT